jgi:fructan beta-fructosidase
MKKWFGVQIGLLLLTLLTALQAFGQTLGSPATDQKYYPQYHFRPQSGWIGDPDGLVYTNSTFHLFWWGHATSNDLIHWKEQPYPMKGGDRSFSYFSGSVVVDTANTSGFGKKSMIALFTRHYPGDTLPEAQALSVSLNEGQTFNYYQNNPVLDIKKIFFRDPQVFRYPQDQLWKMVVSVPNVQEIQIYESRDLKNWNYCSNFKGLGAKNSFWECPDLFQLPIAGTNKKKWVILIGRGPNRVQYFVGNFDGKTFTADQETRDYLEEGVGLQGRVFEDFEKGLTRWKQEGKAFSDTVSSVDFLGKAFAASSRKQGAMGRLISAPFRVSSNAINFLLAGGKHPDSTCINLLWNGRVVRSTTGDNTNVFKWNGWDVRELKGKTVVLEILDRHPAGKQGNIAIDHIIFSDALIDSQLEHANWLDYGPDYYATRTWRNYDGRRSFGDTVFAIGWMGNWDYANKVPTRWGKGFQSVPRTMSLKHGETGYQIIQQPLPALSKLRGVLYNRNNLKINNSRTVNFRPVKNSYEMQVEFKPADKRPFGLNLCVITTDDRPIECYGSSQ